VTGRVPAQVALLAGLGALVLRPPRCVVSVLARRREDILFHVPTRAPVVALTLDDGPHEEVTPRVLEVLRRDGARATFFLLGDRAAARPAVLRAIAGEGHELGNHLWTDAPATRLSTSELERELLRTHAVLAPHASPRLFRPGSGWIGREKVAAARRHGYSCVLGSLYPYDAQVPLSSLTVRDLVRRARPGAILALHEGTADRARIVRRLDGLLAGLARRGYAVVSVSELVARAASEEARGRAQPPPAGAALRSAPDGSRSSCRWRATPRSGRPVPK
jgi:peptidoglycan/xylan/chitin deacetylase (PgdA/CDA1 family)